MTRPEPTYRTVARIQEGVRDIVDVVLGSLLRGTLRALRKPQPEPRGQKPGYYVCWGNDWPELRWSVKAAADQDMELAADLGYTPTVRVVAGVIPAISLWGLPEIRVDDSTIESTDGIVIGYASDLNGWRQA